mmetsp:Transcript_21218/g.34202  ORF Transcript_21218/g.34202 Transcript_21218/m.34202 type:complete len:83 (+) Transcript_21218:561-809(+)
MKLRASSPCRGGSQAGREGPVCSSNNKQEKTKVTCSYSNTMLPCINYENDDNRMLILTTYLYNSSPSSSYSSCFGVAFSCRK